MLLVRLAVNIRLLCLGFWGVKSYVCIFDYAEVITPNLPYCKVFCNFKFYLAEKCVYPDVGIGEVSK